MGGGGLGQAKIFDMKCCVCITPMNCVPVYSSRLGGKWRAKIQKVGFTPMCHSLAVPLIVLQLIGSTVL